jgi:hypothetical protein
MEGSDLAFLLGMVKNLDRALDQYLAGTSAPSEAIPHILGTCEQMRTKDLSDAVKYWLQAIEHHAAEIANPRKRSGADSDFLASGGFLGIQLLKDIYYLRTQLVSTRSAVK